MAELILTKEEIEAATWFELPDDVVGKLCKAKGGELLKASRQSGIAIEKACALYLMALTDEAGYDETEHRIVTKKYGEWIIVARKIG